MKVHGHVTLSIIRDAAELAAAGQVKPFIRITAPDGTVLQLTTNIGEMIGGASKGAREAFEEESRRRSMQ